MTIYAYSLRQGIDDCFLAPYRVDRVIPDVDASGLQIDPGVLDRLPQLSWILFLKCYDDLEMRREEDAKLSRQAYKPVIPPPYRWRGWASDEDNGATGEDLIKFVNDGLLPALRGLSGSDERLKVVEVFKETYNRMLSGYLLRDFNLHTIIRLPNGVFAPYTSIRTNLLFFDRPWTALRSAQDAATVDIWFCEHVLPEGVKNYTKTRPMQFDEVQPILDWWDNRVENERAWKVRAVDVIQTNGGGDVVSVNLDIKNPSRADDLVHLPPAELAESILAKEKQIAVIMEEIKSLLK